VGHPVPDDVVAQFHKNIGDDLKINIAFDVVN
jgi:hypothetical protein